MPVLREGAESFGLMVRINGKPSGTLLSSLDEEAKVGGWEIFLEDGKVGLRVTDGKGTIDARGIAGAPLAPDTWHHVLLSFDAASLRSRTIEVFLDGKSVANSSISAHLPDDVKPTSPLRLGSRHAANGRAAATLPQRVRAARS